MVLLNLILAFIIPPSLILLGLLVFFNNPKSATNKTFILMAVASAGSAFGVFLAKAVTTSALAFFWVKFTMFFASFASPAIVLFIFTFPKDELRINKFILLADSLLAVIFAFSAFFGCLFKNVIYSNGSLLVEQGPLISLFGISFGFHLLVAGKKLIQKFRQSLGREKEQIKYLTFAILLMLIPVGIFDIYLILFSGNTDYVGLGVSSFIIFEGLVFYSITKHRLLDIRFVVARTLAYSLLVVTIAIFYVGSTILISNTLLRTSTDTAQLVVYSILTLIVAFTFQPLRAFFEKITDKVFFKGDYDSNLLLGNLTKIMAETILIDDIAHQLLKKIIGEMRITRGAFVLTDAGKIFVSETQGYKEEPSFSEKDVFSFQAMDKNLIFEETKEGAAKELMRKLNISIVIPLKTQIDHVGLLFLGEKASGEIYSSKDISVLEIFAPEASISFENAKSVEKIRRFNITLKEQVERATKELQGANEELKSLDRLKDEFLSIASHDLRTPMTAIRSYLWMVLNGRSGEIKNPTMKRYLDISYSSSERMIALINDLLNVSRIEAGRVEMNFEKAALKPIVDQVFAEIMSKASEKAIELKYDGVPKLPFVVLDKQRFPEILQNLIGNAIKFTPEKGTITVSAKPSEEKGFVEISVSDTGVGLSEADQDKLFQKYGRLDKSYTAAASSGGTGLGLYITKNYVELHGGRIWVESKLNKGTTFRFTLHTAGPNTIKELISVTQTKQAIPSVPAVKPK